MNDEAFQIIPDFNTYKTEFQRPRPNDDISEKEFVPRVKDIVYFCTGSPPLTVTALIHDEKKIPWAAHVEWFTADGHHHLRCFDLNLLSWVKQTGGYSG